MAQVIDLSQGESEVDFDWILISAVLLRSAVLCSVLFTSRAQLARVPQGTLLWLPNPRRERERERANWHEKLNSLSLSLDSRPTCFPRSTPYKGGPSSFRSKEVPQRRGIFGKCLPFAMFFSKRTNANK